MTVLGVRVKLVVCWGLDVDLGDAVVRVLGDVSRRALSTELPVCIALASALLVFATIRLALIVHAIRIGFSALGRDG